MRDPRFILTFILLLVVDVILAKFVQIAPFLYISMLPAMMLCMPTARETWWTMLVGFACGLLVDGLADGVIGLNAGAAVICAAIQKPLMRFVWDDELVDRGYSISYHRNGLIPIAIAVLIETAVFFLFYVIADSAGMRSFIFNVVKLLVSTGGSLVFGLVVVAILCPYKRQ